MTPTAWLSGASGQIGEVGQAVDHLDGITQQNAALVRQLAGAAQALTGRAEEVSASMRLFRLQAGETGLGEQDAVALRRAARDPTRTALTPA